MRKFKEHETWLERKKARIRLREPERQCSVPEEVFNCEIAQMTLLVLAGDKWPKTANCEFSNGPARIDPEGFCLNNKCMRNEGMR